MAGVLITGAGSGIGRAVAEKFLSAGYHVALVGRRLEPLKEIENAHLGRAKAFTCDVASGKDVARLGQEIASDPYFGQSLTILVNNAGVFERKTFQQTDDVAWLKMFETNFFGAVRVTRELLPHMKKNRGVIINVSSGLGLKPAAETTAYSASKAAMNNWTQGLALEVAGHGVRVNCVCPGIVDTPIHGFHGKGEEALNAMGGLQPLGRVGRPQEIAHAVFSLSGPGSEWTTGAILCVDGGINLV